MEHIQSRTCMFRFFHIILPGIIMAAIVYAPVHAYGADQGGLQSAVVIKIKVSGTENEYGAVLEDLLSAKLHSAGVFLIMDRIQMEKIARRSGFTDFDISDRVICADQGKILSVDKVIAGTAVKNDGKLTLSIRCIDTRTSLIDIIATAEASGDSDISGAIAEISERVSRFYSGMGSLSGNFDFTVGASRFMPVKAYAGYLKPSLGGMISGNINKLITPYTGIHLASGVNIFTPKTKRYDSFSQFFLTCGVAGHFRPTESFRVSPAFSAGSVLSRVSYDVDGRRSPGGFTYKTRYFRNLCVLFETELSLYIYDRWMLSAIPGFMHIPDSENSGTLFSITAGIKTLF